MFISEVLKPVLASIRNFPNNYAFCIKDNKFTYEEFSKYISKIRLALQNCTYTNQIVGLVVNDDIETYASIFALWLEGKAYVPIHPFWPIERCLDIADQIKLDIILNSQEDTKYSTYRVLNTSKLEYEMDCFQYDFDTPDEHAAYLIFTSGSTGKPKGVIITRGNIATFMNSFWQTGIQITQEDRCLQCFDLTFDVSVQGYLAPLTKGACIYTVPHGQIKYIYASNLIEDDKLTFGAMAPSMLRYMRPYFDEIDATSLRTCILTAEACPLSLIEEWFQCAPNTDIYDFYGPTEATIYATYYKVQKDRTNKTLNGIISIGKPLANVDAIIIDELGNEIPIGEKGELCLAGDQVTAGYWENEEKNKTSFFYKDINGTKKRFYHTGDLCYMDKDGDIMYSGRIDQQAKIQGFRVELGEIEYHTREYLKGRNIICIAFENKQMLTEIALFIEDVPFDTTDLIKYLRSKMPSYMIPSRIIFNPNFPLNSNDKIDKNKLKQSIL